MRKLYIDPKTKVVSTAFTYGAVPYESDPETTKNILDGSHEVDHTKTKKDKKIKLKKKKHAPKNISDSLLSSRVKKLEDEIVKLKAAMKKKSS